MPTKPLYAGVNGESAASILDQVNAIVEGIVLLAKRLDITIVAEGIETSEERDALLGLGVDLMQGYLFARPDTSRLPLANFS